MRYKLLDTLNKIDDYLDETICEIEDMDPKDLTDSYVKDNPDEFKASYTPEEVIDYLLEVESKIRKLKWELNLSIDEELYLRG